MLGGRGGGGFKITQAHWLSQPYAALGTKGEALPWSFYSKRALASSLICVMNKHRQGKC